MKTSTEEQSIGYKAVETTKGHTIKVSVRFGRPSQDCRNFGLCRIEYYKEDAPQGSNYAVGMIWCAADGTLCFSFDRNHLSLKTEQKYFAQASFYIEEETNLCSCIAKPIGWTSNPIKKGRYPVEVTAEHIILKIH